MSDKADTPIIVEKRTAEEQEIIDMVARSHGQEWAEAHAQLIINQAIAFGDLEATTKPKRTAEEQDLLDYYLASGRSQEWLDRNAEGILDEARSLGYL